MTEHPYIMAIYVDLSLRKGTVIVTSPSSFIRRLLQKKLLVVGPEHVRAAYRPDFVGTYLRCIESGQTL